MSKRRPTIQPVSRDAPNKKKGTALRECRCFDEVERRIRMGWSSNDVVRMIQEDQNELTHLSAKYVKKMVDEFRQSIPPAELVLSTRNPIAAKHANTKLSNGLNELSELQRLYEMQMKRVEIDVTNEANINKLFPTTGREIFVAMKILKQSATLKMDLGLAKRQLGELSVTGQASMAIATRHGENMGAIMTSPDSRRRVLGMVETLMALSAKADIDATDLVAGAAGVAGTSVIDVHVEDVIDVEPVAAESE
jgi:hypothetical protein